MKPKSGARVQVLNKAAKSATIEIRGPIGDDYYADGVTSKRFAKVMREIGGVSVIDLFIESEGGLVTEGRAIYDMLVRHPATVNAHIEGIAASAATFIAMAGDSIDITEGALFMIHRARVGIFGADRDELRKMADIVELVDDIIADTYAARTGLSRSKIDAWMKEEKWMSGKEAVELGFVDTLIGNKVKVAACAQNLPNGWFVNAPADLRPRRAAVIAFRKKMELV